MTSTAKPILLHEELRILEKMWHLPSCS